MDLLLTFYDLHPLDNKSELEIRQKILLPIKQSDKWLSPISNPIYFETENIKELYPSGNYVNDEMIVQSAEEIIGHTIKEFLKKYGVWDIPAVFISDKDTRIYSKENRDRILYQYSGLVSRPFYIRYDRLLDKPNSYNNWFTTKIIENWNVYKSFINAPFLSNIQYSSAQSNLKNINDDNWILRMSGFIEVLSSEKWIVFSGEDTTYSVKDIVGIKFQDYNQPYNQVIRKFLKLLPINLDHNREFIEALEMIHLDGANLRNFINLLRLIHNIYKQDVPVGKDFLDFYNRILGKLSDFYESHDFYINLDALNNEYFLSIDDITKMPQWKRADDIFYIDDKPNYDLLPSLIKSRIQPHFTNRDKNRFGKIASKIGKRFSSIVQKELIPSPAVKSHTLVSYFNFLPEAIAILESKLGVSLTSQLDKLRTIRVFEKEILEIKISISDSDSLTIPVIHYIEIESNYDLHLSTQNVVNKNKQIADSMNELFSVCL